MSTVSSPSFVDRRDNSNHPRSATIERRQFANSHAELTSEAKALAQAIDRYKLDHRRRFINFEELLGVLKSLGYHK